MYAVCNRRKSHFRASTVKCELIKFTASTWLICTRHVLALYATYKYSYALICGKYHMIRAFIKNTLVGIQKLYFLKCMCPSFRIISILLWLVYFLVSSLALSYPKRPTYFLYFIFITQVLPAYITTGLVINFVIVLLGGALMIFHAQKHVSYISCD